MKPDKTISDAIRAFSEARVLFKKAKKEGLILGNDNHIGDIGEYWVMKYLKSKGQFKEYAPKKNSRYDIEKMDGTRVSVKTITDWSEDGCGTQIKPLCGTKWSTLAGVYLDGNLMPRKITFVDVDEIIKREPFISNAERRRNGTTAFPKFKWWPWLDEYLVYPSA